MAIARFEIGTTTATMVNVEEADIGVAPPDVTFVQYPDTYVGGNGQVHGDGFPQAEWKFPFMTEAQYNTLKIAYCPNGQSSTVVIRTLTDESSYNRYSAIIRWPQNVRALYTSGGYVNLSFLFTHLEAA